MITVVLDDYRLILRKGSSEEIFPYASIVAVRISRSGEGYATYIYPDDRKPVAIHSKSYSEEGTVIDQSGGYSLLVRVLHHHLKEKSQAVFRTGTHPGTIWWVAGIAAMLSFVASICLHYYGFRILNPYLQTLLLSLMAGVIILVSSIRKLPRNYHPANIPIRFLP